MGLSRVGLSAGGLIRGIKNSLFDSDKNLGLYTNQDLDIKNSLIKHRIGISCKSKKAYI